jgi:hypothetical protein
MKLSFKIAYSTDLYNRINNKLRILALKKRHDIFLYIYAMEQLGGNQHRDSSHIAKINRD